MNNDNSPGIDLYRFFDKDDILLYVGISINAAMRSSQHRQDKHWWSDVARMEVEHTKSRDEALQRERDAIRIEQPLHNIVHATRARNEVDEECLPVPFDGVDFINRTAPEDHTRFLLFNAYNNAAKAMDEFAQLCDRSARENDEPTPGRREFLDLLQCMARSLVYGNCCSNCHSWEIMPPIALKIEGTQAHCVYLCMKCKKLDQCWWTLDLAMLASIG